MRTQTLKWYTPEEKEPVGDRILLAKIEDDNLDNVLGIEIGVWSKPLQTFYSLDHNGMYDIFSPGSLKEWADTGVDWSPWDEVDRLLEELRNAKIP